MDKWMKVTVAVTVPALSFLVLNDTVQGLYGPSRDLPLAYSVIEEEPEPEVEEEAAVEGEDTAQEIDTAEAAIEEEPVEEAAAETVEDAAEESPAETVAVVEEAPEEELASADATITEDTAVEETTAAADAPVAEEVATEDAGEMVAMLTPEEMDAGEAAARACASCHQFERERNAAGPHLVGLSGRVIGSVDGFRYSRALQDLNEQGVAWNMENLQVWLENPDAFADGTRMMYKVDDAEERRLIAGWLTQREN